MAQTTTMTALLNKSRDKLRKMTEKDGRRLTSDQVAEVRELLSDGIYSQSEIAVKFGVSKAAIGHINTGRMWREAAQACEFIAPAPSPPIFARRRII